MSESTDKMKTGIKAGLYVDYTFSNNLVLISGLDYVAKGANGMQSNVNYSPTMKIFDVQLGYLQLPISLGYRVISKKNVALTPVAGIYFSYGIHGNSEVKAFSFEAEDQYKYIENSWNPFKDVVFNDWSKTTLKSFDRFDAGITLGLQAELNNILCKASYDMGLSSIWSGYENIKEVKNRSLTVGIGYKF
jgi:hypothetical protein